MVGVMSEGPPRIQLSKQLRPHGDRPEGPGGEPQGRRGTTTAARQRLASCRINETPSLKCAGLSTHKADSSADVNARDAAICALIALLHGADIETIRNAMCRDSRARPSGLLGVPLNLICGARTPHDLPHAMLAAIKVRGPWGVTSFVPPVDLQNSLPRPAQLGAPR
jgi:hypothetical protein